MVSYFESLVYTIHLMYVHEGNSFFAENSDVPETKSRYEVKGNHRTRGKTKLYIFPKDYKLSALLYV